MSFQIWLIFFALWNIKGDILKNVGNQIDLATIDFHSIDQKKKKAHVGISPNIFCYFPMKKEVTIFKTHTQVLFSMAVWIKLHHKH